MREVGIPNRIRAPMTRDERMADEFADRPGRLLDLAEATGNRGLKSIALGLLAQVKERRRCNAVGGAPGRT